MTVIDERFAAYLKYCCVTPKQAGIPQTCLSAVRDTGGTKKKVFVFFVFLWEKCGDKIMLTRQ
jgi:hypothetical protein